tara:strand:- start:1759 stop:3066 length:1308 start_codon:yes stop_codon:yes gene_type:complete
MLTLSFLMSTAFAQTSFVSDSSTSKQNIRSQCFTALKENIAEAKIFSEPLKELQKLTYQDLESRFSTNYKELFSFGVEIDRGDIEMRLYSFGRQTGYIHPPDLPLPAYVKSDKWEEPAKEFIVAEEFIVDPEGEKHFLNCVFFVIDSDNLLNVTRENYLYDGEMISLTKTAKDGSYKAWYSENTSFDYQDKPFVNWKRLFIYPKLTQNDYFNRYDVAEVFPANKVESFDILKFFLEVTSQVQDYDNLGFLETSYFKNENGENVKIDPPKEFLPVAATLQDDLSMFFPLADYYQAIENMFPRFAERLSFRGTLEYDTFKKLFAIAEDDEDARVLWNTLGDYRSLANYDLDKKNKEKEGIKVSDPEMDKLLRDIEDAESVTQRLLVNAEISRTLEDDDADQGVGNTLISWLVGVLSTFVILTLVILLGHFAWRVSKK